MESDLLHSFQVVSQLGIQVVGDDLSVLAVLVVLLVVQEPGGDVELQWLSDDELDGLELLLGDLTCALVEVDLSLLADEVGESSANTSNLAQGVHHLTSAVNVGVQHTQQTLEIVIFNDKRHDGIVK